MLVLVFPTFMGTTGCPKAAATSALSNTRSRNLLIRAERARAAEWEVITSVPDALKISFFIFHVEMDLCVFDAPGEKSSRGRGWCVHMGEIVCALAALSWLIHSWGFSV